MEEVWKDIDGYDGYQVSNMGRVRSISRYVRVGRNGKRFAEGRIIKPVRCPNGYLEMQFSRRIDGKVHLLHRLVAQAFIPNPQNLPQVNHKDENLENCRADNLEWCTAKYNANYGTRMKRWFEHYSKKKPVCQYDMDGNFIAKYCTIQDAANKNGIKNAETISRACRGKLKTSGGYKWRFASEVEQ